MGLLGLVGLGVAYIFLFSHQRAENAALVPESYPDTKMLCINVAAIVGAKGNAYLWWKQDFQTEWVKALSEGTMQDMGPHTLTAFAKPGDTVKAEICGYP
jgi:hypothetical protein